MTDKLVEVNCQTPNCKNKVMIKPNHPYFGILCSDCNKPISYEYKNEKSSR